MTRQELFDWCLQQYGTEPDYPWNDNNAVLRHLNSKKWYGVVLEVNGRKLGLDEDGIVDVLNVKCDPIMIGSLRLQDGFFSAYHMNKDSWITVALDGSVPDDKIKMLLNESYAATALKARGKKASEPHTNANKEFPVKAPDQK